MRISHKVFAIGRATVSFSFPALLKNKAAKWLLVMVLFGAVLFQIFYKEDVYDSHFSVLLFFSAFTLYSVTKLVINLRSKLFE